MSKLLTEKWAPVLDHTSLPSIKDQYKRECTAILLENQQRASAEASQALFEAAPPVNAGGGAGINVQGGGELGAQNGVAGYDPILISLVRRAMPQLIAYDVCGVQPMTQPVGLIFAMKARYVNDTTVGDPDRAGEALFNEADSDYSGTGANTQDSHEGSYPSTNGTDWSTGLGTGTGMTTGAAEVLGYDNDGTFNQMAFSIEKTAVTAKSRALKAEYSVELAQDLKSVHGLDAEGELSNILTTEILAEINREVIRTIYKVAQPGAAFGTTVQGIFDLDTDSNGRWSVEKFKGLLFQIEREANAIAQKTRRGRGNFILCSSDVASALAMAGVLDYTPALEGNAALNVDDASTTFAGILNGKYKVYVDPYSGGTNQNGRQFFVAGYKGSSAYDAGLFYCPYVPLQMVRAVDPNTFQPKIGFKTRYGMVSNPFVQLDSAQTPYGNTDLVADENYYYRKVLVNNIM